MKRLVGLAFERLDRRGYCWPVLITFLRLISPQRETAETEYDRAG